MNSLKILLIAFVITVPALASEGMALNVAQSADQVTDTQELGSLQVAEVGPIKLSARRVGTKLVVQAVGEKDTVIGLAESVVGTVETPIFITTPAGIKLLKIVWKAP